MLALLERNPARVDVEGAMMVEAFRRMARRLILGARASDLDTRTAEQEAALLICDRIADMFDPVLGGLDEVSQDELARMASSVLDLRDLQKLPVEQRRARGVLIVEAAGARFATQSAEQRETTARTLILQLTNASHPVFARLETNLAVVDSQLAQYSARARPGPGKSGGRRIFARLCVECGAFVEGGDADSYKPPRTKEGRAIMEREAFQATKKAAEREGVRRPDLNKGTYRGHS
jgi:hypothetical protein